MSTAISRPGGDAFARRFANEILLYSGQYALFYVLMHLANQQAGFFSDLGHAALLVSLIAQTTVLSLWGEKPVVRFLGSLITPVVYTVFELQGFAAFILDIGHFNFWLFSLLVAGLQTAARVTRRPRGKALVEFLSAFISVMIFLLIYFYFDISVTHQQEVAAGTLSASQLSQELRITTMGKDLAEFLSDVTHIYVVVGGTLLGIAIGMGRVTITRLSERMRELFGTYVDGRVRDRILSTDGHLGESKDVAVLFSDIRSFTTITEASPARGIVEMLNTYFTAWDVVSDAHGGIIDKFIGDAVMIVFEPREGRDPAEDAVACAVSMLGSLDTLRKELAVRGLPILWDIGVGVSLGPVIMGNIGSERRRNYTVIGDTVNTASRLEAACKDHHRHLIVSQGVYDRLKETDKGRFSCLGDIPLKGKSAAIHAYGA